MTLKSTILEFSSTMYLDLLVESRSDKFNYILKNKLTKNAQIAVNISFDVGCQDLILFFFLSV